MDGLPAQGFGDVVAGLGIGGAEKQQGVAVADDRFPTITVELLTLADVLDDGLERDAAGTQGGGEDFEVGDASDVGELVHEAHHRHRELPVGQLISKPECPLEEHGEHERAEPGELLVDVGDDQEQDGSFEPDPVELKAVGFDESSNGWDMEGREPHSGGDDDGGRGLGCRLLVDAEVRQAVAEEFGGGHVWVLVEVFPGGLEEMVDAGDFRFGACLHLGEEVDDGSEVLILGWVGCDDECDERLQQ